MAGRTAHFALNDRMMGALIDLHPDRLMALKTNFRFSWLLVAIGMEVVAGVAGNIIAVMLPHIPCIKISNLLVAAQAFL
jgi:hypothetical protein